MAAGRGTVTFTATHARGLIGQDITVIVKAGEHDVIASVTVALDGFELEELELGSGTESYTRSFSGVGSGSPGAEHTLVVTARDDDGVAHGATTRWSDQ